MKTINVVTIVLVIIGGLNWGLVGFFDFNLVSFLFQGSSAASRIVYSLVGLSALYQILVFNTFRYNVKHDDIAHHSV